MVSIMKGDWLLVLALRERASKESVVEEEVGEEEVAEQGDLAVWLQQRFNGYFTVLVKNHILNFLNFFRYLHSALAHMCQLEKKKKKIFFFNQTFGMNS